MVVVAVVESEGVVGAVAVVEMVAGAGIFVESVTGAVALSEAEVAVEIVVGLEGVSGTAAGNEVVVAAAVAFERAAGVAGIAVEAEVVAGIAEPVLETGMAELASSLAGVDWMQVVKIATLDWMGFGAGTSVVIRPGRNAEVVMEDEVLLDPGTAVEVKNLVDDSTDLVVAEDHWVAFVMCSDVALVASLAVVEHSAEVVCSLVVILV